MWDVIGNGVLAGYAIAIPVGAIAVLIINTSMRCGFVCGASAGAGAATADLLYALLASLAGSAAAGFLQTWEQPLRWTSAVILVGLAVNGLVQLRRPPVPIEPDAAIRRGELALTYGRFLGLTIINPATVIYFGTVVLGAGAGRPLTVAHAILFAGAAFAASLSWQTLLAAIGSTAGRRLSPTFRTITGVVGNLFILAIAARIAF